MNCPDPLRYQKWNNNPWFRGNRNKYSLAQNIQGLTDPSFKEALAVISGCSKDMAGVASSWKLDPMVILLTEAAHIVDGMLQASTIMRLTAIFIFEISKWCKNYYGKERSTLIICKGIFGFYIPALRHNITMISECSFDTHITLTESSHPLLSTY